MIPLPPAEFTHLTPEEIAAIEAELRSEDRSRMGVIGWMLFSLFITAAVVGVWVA